MLLRRITVLFRLVSTLAAGTLRSPVLWGGALIVVFGIALAVADERKVHAQEEQVEGALLLIMDASGSMNREDDDGTPLIDGAKEALNGVVDALPEGTPVGLRVYGHRVPDTDRARGCRDTELIQPVEPLDGEEMKGTIADFEAKGFTPIGRSLQEAADDLPPEGPRTIVLVSDGEDTCAPPPPCEAARGLVADGIDVKVETVGFFIQDNPRAQEQLQCIAEETGGSYRGADSAAELVDELETISTREARRFATEGDEVEGGTFTDEAPTIEPGRTYQDLVQTGETLFYRVEVPPGAAVTARAVRAPPTDPEFEDTYTTFYAYLTDIDDSDVARADGYSSEFGREVDAKTMRGVEVPEGVDELFLKVEMQPYRDGEVAEFPVELSVEIDGGEETTSEPTVEETEPEEDTDPQDQASNGADEPEEPPVQTEQASEEGGNTANPVLLFLSGMLAMLVIGLAIALYVVLRRRGGGRVS